jgi:hypothetical protein
MVLGRLKVGDGVEGINRHVEDIVSSVGPAHDPPATVSVVIGVDAKLPTPGIARPSPTGQAADPDPAWMARLVASL